MNIRLTQKLHSRRGASFLLALLFFLICALAASSVLMAAASNAGRSRSARAEHQVYLTVSSAVRLLCDELTDCQYVGRYDYREEDIYLEGPNGEQIFSRTDTFLAQETGTYQYTGGSETAKFEELLRDDFDYLFSKKFEPHKEKLTSVTTLSGLTAPQPHVLTVTPDSEVEALDSQPVTVTLEVQDDYSIHLTAALDGFTMTAELARDSSEPDLPSAFPGSGQTAPAAWRLGWIDPGDSFTGGGTGGG